jgi:acyl-CoA synthetase (AMP-forming)/AMP-acid ligase II
MTITASTTSSTNVGSHLRRRARMSPDLEAIVDVAAGRRFTYTDLHRRATQVAAALQGLGLTPGDRIAILAANGHQFAETFYGAALAGMVVVPLNWRLTASELTFILRDSGASALCFSQDFDALAHELHDNPTGEPSTVAHWVRIAADGGPDWAVGHEELIAAASAEPQPAIGGGSDPLFIMYTSGTTGLPKGAVHSHDTVEWAILTVLASVDMRYRDRYLISMPLFHVGALNPLTCIVYLGATAVLMRQFDTTEVWTVLRDEQITNTLAVPAMLDAMLSTLPAVEQRPPALRWFMSGATPVPTSLIETYTELGFEILQVYGLTETCGPACVIGPDDAVTHIGSTGKAFFHTDVRLVDRDGNDVDVDVPGEVLVSGRHVMVGYWNRPDDTAAAIRDGWLSTGDIAVRDADGFIFIRDRIKDMIISGGENVYPAEIEDLLLTHPDIADAAVISMPSARWGESPLAVIVATRVDLDEQTVLEHCAGRLARYKQPRKVVFTDAIPRNPTGKILKRLLRDQFAFDAPE